MKLLVNWTISALIIFIVGYILKGVHIESFWTALVIAVVMGLLNAFVRPIIVFFTFPLTVVTLGLFLLVINALLVLLASNIVPGFSVGGFWWALLFSMLVSGLKMLLANDLKK